MTRSLINLKKAVNSVPAIILFDKNKKLKKIWQAGLTMQLTRRS